MENYEDLNITDSLVCKEVELIPDDGGSDFPAGAQWELSQDWGVSPGFPPLWIPLVVPANETAVRVRTFQRSDTKVPLLI